MKYLFSWPVAVLVFLFFLFATGVLIGNSLTLPQPEDRNFKSADKLSGVNGDFSFALFGDNKNAFEPFDELIRKVNGEPAAFAFDNGDLVFDGEMAKYDFFLRQVERLRKPLLTSVGNHDTKKGGRTNYYDLFGPYYYSFTVGQAYFIVVDNSNLRDIDPAQMEWLRAELDASQGYRYRFVLMHCPIFDPRAASTGEEHALSDRGFALRLNRLFDEKRVTMVFASHIHGLFQGKWGGTPYIISGGAGAVLQGSAPANSVYHYVIVTVTARGVSSRVVKLKGPRLLSRYLSAAWVYIYSAVATFNWGLTVIFSVLYFSLFALYHLEARDRRRARANDAPPGRGTTSDQQVSRPDN